LLDIDYFKKINDTYGHVVGDNVLIEISNIIKDCLRDSDLVARLGGEEFGILLPDTPIEGAYIVANRLCQAIASYPFRITEDGCINCTVSIGMSSAEISEDPVLDAKDLYQKADIKLYQAKNTGRNQVTVS
jgi:diguanylate cyclase (GGDEF)-like protein